MKDTVAPLSVWLARVIETMDALASAGPSPFPMLAFLEARYDQMSTLYPHDPFSVNEATPVFFAETLAYLTNGIPETRPGAKPEDAKHDLYWRRYRDWMRKHA